MNWKSILLVFFALLAAMGVLVMNANRAPGPPVQQVYIKVFLN